MRHIVKPLPRIEKFWVLHDSKGNIVKGKKVRYQYGNMYHDKEQWKINGILLEKYSNPEIETERRLINLAKKGYLWKLVDLPCQQYYEEGQKIPIDKDGFFWENTNKGK